MHTQERYLTRFFVRSDYFYGAAIFTAKKNKDAILIVPYNLPPPKPHVSLHGPDRLSAI